MRTTLRVCKSFIVLYENDQYVIYVSARILLILRYVAHDEMFKHTFGGFDDETIMQRKLHSLGMASLSTFGDTEKTYALVENLNSPGRSIQVYVCRRDYCSIV